MKICNTCLIEQDINNFPKNGKSIRNRCKSCTNNYKKQWIKPIDIITFETMKICTECNTEKLLNSFHKSKEGKYGVKSICKNCKIKLSNKHYTDNKEDVLEQKKLYYINNKKIIVERIMKYRTFKYNTDSQFKMIENIRGLIRNAFKRQYTIKSDKTTNILGCTFEEFKTHIEAKFDNKMNWNNQGSYWVLDHIHPISLASNEAEVYALNHYTNFQPLEKLENIRKGNKI